MLLSPMPQAAGFGSEVGGVVVPYFWVMARGRPPISGAHLAAGGRDDREPGPRPLYHAAYYGGFVLDPDGNNVEAVCHQPPD